MKNTSKMRSDMSKDDTLQALCREYLKRLRHIACRYGLGGFVDDTINANLRKECEGTKKEVDMLSRIIDEERISRTDIPKALGKSYRRCVEDGDFDKIEKLKRVGIYSKTDTLILKSLQDDDKTSVHDMV